MVREKIIFLSEKNPYAKKDWSGIPFFMMKALNQHYLVTYVRVPGFSLLKKAGYYFGRFFNSLTGKRYIFDYGKIMSMFYGFYCTHILRRQTEARFIFVPAGLTEIAMVKTNIPIVSVGDCSTLQLFNYYPALKDVSAVSRREIRAVEASAFRKCAKVIFSSDWARDFVTHEYGVEAITIPFGSNVVMGNLGSRAFSKSQCNLLFVGVDWLRKGGKTVLEILAGLHAENVPARLTIVGMDCSLNPELARYVTVIKHLNKDSEEGENAYLKLLQDAHFFILPTLADCTPIVIAEAFSAGLPVLTTRTGGIPTMVKGGETGYLFEPGDANGYVRRIVQLLNNPEEFHRISRNCIEASATTFNWSAWADAVKNNCAAL